MKESGKPNVLFIICDDLNNAISGMGRKPFAPTPNIERIMRRGISFRNAYANCPICLPSRNSLFSGLYPHTTGSFTLFDDRNSISHIVTTDEYERQPIIPLLRDAVMMPKHFKDNGYTTLGAGKLFHEGMLDSSYWDEYGNGVDYGPMLMDENQRFHLHQNYAYMLNGEPLNSYVKRYEGIDRFWLGGRKFEFELSCGSLGEMQKDGRYSLRNYDNTPFRYISDEDRDLLVDEKTSAWGVSQLRKNHENPFFLGLGFMKPHTPLNVPQKYFDLFPPDTIELPPFLKGDTDDCARALVEHRPYGFLLFQMIQKGGEQMWRKYLQSYLACIAFLDEQVGKVLTALESSRYADNTIIVFTSDNGYHLGEKGYLFKDSLWEEGGQIPLVVSVPDTALHPGVCRRPVSLIDIYPTLVDLCGLPANPNVSTHGHPLEGQSLRPLLEHPENDGNGTAVALSSVRGDTGIHHSVRSSTHRYSLCQNGEEELYDHRSDPYEWHNLAYDPGLDTVRRKLRGKLLEIIHPEKNRIS